jgi:hypothetical protein
MTYTARWLLIVRGRLWSRTALIGALGGLAFVGFSVAQRIEWGVVLGPVIGDSDILEDSAINGRGDKVLALTDAAEPKDPDKTDIRIRRAHSWFWAPLLRSESYGIHVTLKWRNDDTLDVNLDFGCLVHMTQPLDRVGRIHVVYHFAYNDPMLDLDLAGSGPTDRSACKGVRASG